MSWEPFQIIGGAYSDDAKPWSAQDTVNWIPVLAEKNGTRSLARFRDAPGLRLFANTVAGSVRGIHNAEGFLAVVSGTNLYRVATDGSVTTLGTVPGSGRVAFAHNQVTGGSQIVVANGSSGYVYDTAASTFTQITDDGFPGAIALAYMDSYIIGVEPLGRFWFTSDLADATSYNTLNRYEAESAPDKIVGLIVNHQEVVVFGERTIEFFEDTGADNITFQTKQGLQAQIGAASRWAIVPLDNGIAWLGNDGSFYILDGYTPVRISTHAIEQAIAGLDWSQCFATVFNDSGHKIVYFTFPDQTWGYDAASKEWHRRKSYGMSRWRLSDLVFWNGSWIGGDFSNGNLYKLDWNASDENGAQLERRRITGVTHADENKLRVDAMALVFDTGRGTILRQPAFHDPNLLANPNNWVDQDGVSPPASWNGTSYVYNYVGGQPTTNWELNPVAGLLPVAGDVVAAQVVSTAVPDQWFVNGTPAIGDSYDWFSPGGFGPNDFSSDLGVGFAEFSLLPGAGQDASSYSFSLTPIASPAPDPVRVMPKVDLRYSKNGARTYSEWRQRDLGEEGEYAKRCVFRRLGRSRQFVFDVRVTDPVPVHLIAASIKVKQET